MTRVIIVIDERETNTLVSNALEISLISYANRMQISTLLPYAGRCKKKCALKFDRAWDYVRYEDPWSSGVMVDDRYIVHTCH